MDIRHVQGGDGSQLRTFLARVPGQDASFLKEDLDDPAVVEAWLVSGRITRAVCLDDNGAIVGVASIAPGVGRSDHVAELRLVVDVRSRRAGIGRRLAQYAVVTAVRAGYRKITIEVGATQVGIIDLFQGLGFTPEALHRNQIRADDGSLLDVVVLAHSVDDNWEALHALGERGANP